MATEAIALHSVDNWSSIRRSRRDEKRNEMWNMRNEMLNNPIAEETAGKTGRTKLEKQG